MPYNRIYSNKEEAIQAFGELYNIPMSPGEDGRQELHRYFDEDGNVASLIGIYHYKGNGGYGDIEIKDGNINNCIDLEPYLTEVFEELQILTDLVDSATTAISELEAQIDICCPPPEKNYLTFTNVGGNDQTLILRSYGGNNPILYYSLDNGETFNDWIQVGDSRSVVVEPGNNVKIYGDNPTGFSFSEQVYSYFTCADLDHDKWESSGDVTNLITEYGTDTIPCNYCFVGLFEYFRCLITPADFPATQLTDWLYEFV